MLARMGTPTDTAARPSRVYISLEGASGHLFVDGPLDLFRDLLDACGARRDPDPQDGDGAPASTDAGDDPR